MASRLFRLTETMKHSSRPLSEAFEFNGPFNFSCALVIVYPTLFILLVPP